VRAWESLESTDTSAMRELAAGFAEVGYRQTKIRAAQGAAVQPAQALRRGPRVHAPAEGRFPRIRGRLGIWHRSQADAGGVTDALSAWQERTGYQNVWGWPRLAESLSRLHSPSVDKLLRRDIMNPVNEPGATPFERVANSLKRSETFTRS